MRSDHPSRCSRCLYYCRAGATFLFSHIGLCGLVVCYTIMGAFTFELLEAQNEQDKRNEMKKHRISVVEELWLLTSTSEVLSETNWTIKVSSKLAAFETKLVKAVRKEGYDGNDDSQLQWSFSGALLYSIIVITTIGYGNIAPKTIYGKVVTILYAIVGIPLMLLCLSNIGDAMAHSFKFIYWKVCCYLCVKPKKRRRHKSFRHRQHRDRFDSELRIPAPSDYNKSDLTSGYGGPTTNISTGSTSYLGNTSSISPRETPKFPSSNPHSRQDRYSDRVDASRVPIISNKYILQSSDEAPSEMHPPAASSVSGQISMHGGSATLGHNASVSYRAAAAAASASNNNPATIPRTRNQQQAAPPSLPPPPPAAAALSSQSTKNRCSWKDDPVDIDFEMDDSASEDSEEEEDDVSVPIWLCLAIVVGYICGGAILFCVWEQWDFLDSSYFCFVTLTTIGFGDLVPGTAVLSDDAKLTLGLCALYLLFGMALLAMSFNLVQEEVTKSVKCIGKRLGILSDDDEDN